jgi:hypothetical protein
MTAEVCDRCYEYVAEIKKKHSFLCVPCSVELGELTWQPADAELCARREKEYLISLLQLKMLEDAVR